MSKLIDLTGLSRAITKIKEWVLNQRTHYGDEQILDSKKLSEYQKRMGNFDHRFTVDRGDVSVFISVGGFEKNIKLEPGETQTVNFIENYDNLSVTISFTLNDEKTQIYVEFRTEDNFSIHIEDSDYIKVISVQKPLNEIYISNDIARKSDVVTANTPDWNAKVGEAGYIENKPFSDESNKLEWYYDDSHDGVMCDTIVDKVFIDGKEYDLTLGEILNIDNTNFGIGYDDYTGKIKVYGAREDNVDWVTDNVLVGGIKQLDERFIPDTIARKSEIEELRALITELQNKLT